MCVFAYDLNVSVNDNYGENVQKVWLNTQRYENVLSYLGWKRRVGAS